LITNNARFLILPWIKSKNLASKILSSTARHLPDDWEEKYNIRPVLLEFFVQRNRFTGTCYKAANWQLCGQTKGRGKLGPPERISVPIKDIWVYPLDKKFRSILKNWLMNKQAEYLQLWLYISTFNDDIAYFNDQYKGSIDLGWE